MGFLAKRRVFFIVLFVCLIVLMFLYYVFLCMPLYVSYSGVVYIDDSDQIYVYDVSYDDTGVALNDMLSYAGGSGVNHVRLVSGDVDGNELDCLFTGTKVKVDMRSSLHLWDVFAISFVYLNFYLGHAYDHDLEVLYSDHFYHRDWSFCDKSSLNSWLGFFCGVTDTVSVDKLKITGDLSESQCDSFVNAVLNDSKKVVILNKLL